jgi:hypothetical protein
MLRWVIVDCLTTGMPLRHSPCPRHSHCRARGVGMIMADRPAHLSDARYSTLPRAGWQLRFLPPRWRQCFEMLGTRNGILERAGRVHELDSVSSCPMSNFEYFHKVSIMFTPRASIRAGRLVAPSAHKNARMLGNCLKVTRGNRTNIIPGVSSPVTPVSVPPGRGIMRKCNCLVDASINRRAGVLGRRCLLGIYTEVRVSFW